MVTQKELANLLGLTARQVANLVERGMPSVAGDGRREYDAPACIAWYRDAKIAEAVADAGPDTLDAQRTRKTAAEARLAELELARLEGSMLTVEDAAREVDALLDRLRSVLLSFTSRHAHLLVGKRTIPEVAAVLDPAVGDLMAALVEAGTVTEEAA